MENRRLSPTRHSPSLIAKLFVLPAILSTWAGDLARARMFAVRLTAHRQAAKMNAGRDSSRGHQTVMLMPTSRRRIA